jgi:hypothetical protein
LPGDAISHAHTQNINLRLENGTNYTVAMNSAINIPAAGVLRNVLSAGAAPVQAILVSGPLHGSLTLHSDGSFSYVPNAGFTGRDGFVVRAVGSLTAADLIEVDIAVLRPGAASQLSADDQAFLAAAGMQLLGHPLDALNESILSQFVIAGADRNDLAEKLWEIPENLANRVNALYQAILHRPADVSGRNYYVGRLADGATENQVATSLLLSTEYQQSRGSNKAFVTGLYQDLLGRAPDSASEKAWVTALNNGMTRNQIIDAFLNSAERRTLLVRSLTTQLLGQPSSQSNLPAGTDAAEIGQAILASPEFAARAAILRLSPQQRVYIEGLSKALTGRAPTTSELGILANELIAGTRTIVVAGLWESNQHLATRVDSVYRSILHRPADPTGITVYVQMLQQGGTEDDLTRTLLASVEYASSHSSNSAFVDGLYRDVLARSADTAGKNGWVSALNGGLSRADAAKSFLQSDERRLKIIDSLYLGILGRRADVAGRTAYLNEMRNEITGEEIARRFLASDEYFARLTR